MNQDAFVEEKKKRWDVLTGLLDRARGNGIRSFSAEEVKLLGGLYRNTCSDLSYARSRRYDQNLVRYLNQLARRAYGVIYLTEKDRKGDLLKFFTQEFPRLFRENFSYILGAALLFLITSGVAYIWDQADFRFARSVVPPQFLEIWDKSEKDSSQGQDKSPAAFPLMSSWYLTNNFKVGLSAFVLGIFLGLGTFYSIAYNGLIMGAILSLVLRSHYHVPFFSFILAHSFIELTAIFICGGAGFMIARAIIAPGEMSIGDSLNHYGRPAVKLVMGTIPMFLLAGIIEASFSRLELPMIIKALFGFSTLALMIWYFRGSERKRKFKVG